MHENGFIFSSLVHGRKTLPSRMLPNAPKMNYTVTNEKHFKFNSTNIPDILISFFGIISHVLLFAAFIKDPLKCFRNTGIYFIVNLAVSDFVVCLCGPFDVSATSTEQTQLYIRSICSVPNSASVITIFSIALDRYIMVKCPLKHRLLMSAKVMVGWIVLIWVLSALWLFKWLIFGMSAKDEPIISYVFFSIVLLAVLLYTGTYFSLKNQSRNISLQNSTNTITTRNQEMRILKEKRFLTTILLIASITFACVVPTTLVYQFTSSTTDDGDYNEHSTAFNFLRRFMMMIYYFNFAINPLIYFIRFPNYRKTFYCMYLKK